MRSLIRALVCGGLVLLVLVLVAAHQLSKIEACADKGGLLVNEVCIKVEVID